MPLLDAGVLADDGAAELADAAGDVAGGAAGEAAAGVAGALAGAGVVAAEALGLGMNWPVAALKTAPPVAAGVAALAVGVTAALVVVAAVAAGAAVLVPSLAGVTGAALVVGAAVAGVDEGCAERDCVAAGCAGVVVALALLSLAVGAGAPSMMMRPVSGSKWKCSLLSSAGVADGVAAAAGVAAVGVWVALVCAAAGVAAGCVVVVLAAAGVWLAAGAATGAGACCTTAGVLAGWAFMTVSSAKLRSK